MYPTGYCFPLAEHSHATEGIVGILCESNIIFQQHRGKDRKRRRAEEEEERRIWLQHTPYGQTKVCCPDGTVGLLIQEEEVVRLDVSVDDALPMALRDETDD